MDSFKENFLQDNCELGKSFKEWGRVVPFSGNRFS